MVSPLAAPLDPATVSAVLVGGSWLSLAPGSFSIGTLRVGSGASGESIRNDIWFTASLADGGDRVSGPFASLQAVRH